MVAGNLDLPISDTPECLSQAQGRWLCAQAVTNTARYWLLAEVPAVNEAGMPELRITSWNAVQALAGLLEPSVEWIAEAVRWAAAKPVLAQKAGDLGISLIGADVAESVRVMAVEVAHYVRVVAAANIRPE